ncbi:Endoribonuclease L-PSP [Beutenbergia cavernae DSM 12333]|uniref:Endoribonuclease L-PSP n=1 Tax=Beutenbergia cavernae (strain ATCC BAA-8 / DSM 12333 / CCUG 43141 / JCM 11478 / NBRC 16432 / NCIMB 13614 / HKI 0122) TaxID=471853 RepID=C5BXN5_BEUC1|nr:Rid family hydrolase [Beutenbergia cavernae]ACQ80918.1 Endoribonuclease L-PSP [Beutenbergia cavernae DSM 12333]
MDEITLLRPPGLVASPAFSHVAVVPPGATTILVGGQNAVDAEGALVGGDDVAAQVTRVMENLVVALEAADVGLADVVSMTILFLDGVDLDAAYGAAMPFLGSLTEPPLVTGARVAGLGVPGALVEVSAVAAVVR